MSCFTIVVFAFLAGVVLAFSFAACHWRADEKDKKNKGFSND